MTDKGNSTLLMLTELTIYSSFWNYLYYKYSVIVAQFGMMLFFMSII